MVTTVLPGSSPRCLQVDRARRQHLVPVDDRALGVGEQRAIGIPVVAHAGVGAHAEDLCRHDLRVQGPTPVVDVLAVGIGVDRVHRGAEPLQQRGSEFGGGPVGAVHHDAHPLQRGLGGIDEVGEVPLTPVADRQRLAGTIGGIVRPGQHGFDLVLDRVGQLRPGPVEELDAVVLGRVVRRRDHDPRRGAQGRGEERDRGGGFDTGDQGVATRVPDAFDQCVLEPFPGGTRVSAHHERRMTLAVAAEDDDRGIAQSVGEVLGELLARETAYAVGAEQSSHQEAEGYCTDDATSHRADHPGRSVGSRSSRSARIRRSISSRIGRTSSTDLPEGSSSSQSR